MTEQQVEQVKRMRGMDDMELMDFYETIVTATHHAKVTAQFDKYDEHYPILNYTREEVGRRLRERKRLPRGMRSDV